MPLLAMAIAVREIVRGNQNAPLLLFPLLGIMIPGGLLVFLRSVTDFDFGIIRPHMLEITLAFEALAFSLALAARVRFHKLAAVSARARLAEAEYESARRYADLQERERARIASDLHDSIGHNLVMISGLLERGTRSGVAPEDLASAAGLSKRTVQHVRQISHSLHPATLSHLGWDGAIDSLFDDLKRTHGIAVTIARSGGTPDLPDGAKLHLYRILQEIVSNIARHAAASRCDASFRNEDGTLHVRVADDGVGLDGQKDLQAGLGFASIDQRLKNIGGTWVVNSGADQGVEVALTIPIDGSGDDGGRKTGDGAAR
jgi:signal transduction histidine kinase